MSAVVEQSPSTTPQTTPQDAQYSDPAPYKATSANALTTQTPVREELIRNAVSFLQNPAVVGTPLSRRIAFLKSKGLSSSEIELALQQASALSPAAPTLGSPPPLPPLPPPPLPASASFSRSVLGVLVAMGIGGGLALLAKDVIWPRIEHWFSKKEDSHGDSDRSDNQEEGLERPGEMAQDSSVRSPGPSHDELLHLHGDLKEEIDTLRQDLAGMKASLPAPIQSLSGTSFVGGNSQNLATVPESSTIPGWQQKPYAQMYKVDGNRPASVPLHIPIKQESCEKGDRSCFGAPCPQAFSELLQGHTPTDIRNVNDSPLESSDVGVKGSKPSAPKPWERT